MTGPIHLLLSPWVRLVWCILRNERLHFGDRTALTSGGDGEKTVRQSLRGGQGTAGEEDLPQARRPVGRIEQEKDVPPRSDAREFLGEVLAIARRGQLSAKPAGVIREIGREGPQLAGEATAVVGQASREIEVRRRDDE